LGTWFRYLADSFKEISRKVFTRFEIALSEAEGH
jgi:hypothetical protein